jgi:Flp pilus assembly protein TadG
MPVMNAPSTNTAPDGPIARRSGQRGQTLVIFALFLVVLAGAAALTIDYASWLKARRDYQNGADAAALAGAQFLTRPIDETKRGYARDAAWASLKSQLGLSFATPTGDTGADAPVTNSGYRMWVSTPPLNAGLNPKYPGASKGPTDDTIFVWVEKDNPAYLSGVYGQGNRVVSAWATAGSLPGRWAVITLRKNGQASSSNPEDISIQGGSTLNVINGDVGGNWGLAIGGNPLNTHMRFLSNPAGADTYGLYLTEPVSGQTPGNGFLPYQVIDASGAPVTPQYFPEVPDPNYPLPSAFSTPLQTSPPSSGAVPKAAGTNGSGDISIPNNSGTAIAGTPTAGTLGSSTTCDPLTSPTIGPGWYNDITVGNGACLILDPLHQHATPDASSGTALPSGQQPGIFYITGNLDVKSGSLVVGDGVSLVFYPSTSSSDGLVVNGGAVDLNRGLTGSTSSAAGPNMSKGAFLSDGTYTYTGGAYTASNSDNTRFGVAIYVAKPSQIGNTTVDANTSLIKVNATNSALAWSGVTYAPHDNISLAGQPSHDAVGQLVSWTVKFDGGATIEQTYSGPEIGVPYLIEPHIGQ